MPKHIRAVMRVAALVMAVACANDSEPNAVAPRAPLPFSISMENSVTIQIPRTLQISWRGGRDGDAITWVSSDTSVANVSPSGLISTTFPGTSIVTARRGSESASVTVNATATMIEIMPGISLMRLDSAQSLTAIVRDVYGSPLAGVAVSWLSGNTDVVDIDSRSGLVTPIARGTAWVAASGGGARGFASVYVDMNGGQLALSTIGSVSNPTCALEADTGHAYCWGDNHAGALGAGEQDGSDLPILVHGARRFTSLTVGTYATCGIEAVTTLAYCWGYNALGDLGDGTLAIRWEPTLVWSGDVRFRSLSASGTHTCGVDRETGYGYCWGKEGLIGDGTRNRRLTPTLVGAGESRFPFTEISAGLSHSCGIEATSGAAFCWGSNTHGQLGDGTLGERLLPEQVDSHELRFRQISAGSMLTCGVSESGAAYCWGSNEYGQVGNGTTANATRPTLVGDGTQRFSSISATGAGNACAIEQDTKLAYCWGRYVGLPANSGSLYRAYPTLVGGGKRFSVVVAGYNGGCGVEAETGVGYCWSYSQMTAATILPWILPTSNP